MNTCTEEEYFYIQELQIKNPKDLIEDFTTEIKHKKPRMPVISSIVDLVHVNSFNKDGLSLLHLAILHEHLDATKLLLKKGANPFLEQIDPPLLSLLHQSVIPETTPFHTAISLGNVETIHTVLSNNDYSTDIAKNITYLCTSIRNNNMEVFKLLLPFYKDVNVKVHGTYPILYAVQNKNLEFTQILLDHGANPRVVNSFDNTPLHFAVSSKNQGVVKLLLKYNVDVHCKNAFGTTPLDWGKNSKKLAKILRNYIKSQSL